MSKPMLRKAMHTLKFLSRDAETQRLYEMRQKFLHDETSMLAGAREEGEHQKAIEVAKSCLLEEQISPRLLIFPVSQKKKIMRLKKHLTN
jgi:hypothetical protein